MKNGYSCLCNANFKVLQSQKNNSFVLCPRSKHNLKHYQLCFFLFYRMFFQTLPHHVGRTSPKPSCGGQSIRRQILTPVLMTQLVIFLFNLCSFIVKPRQMDSQIDRLSQSEISSLLQTKKSVGANVFLLMQTWNLVLRVSRIYIIKRKHDKFAEWLEDIFENNCLIQFIDAYDLR